MVFNSSRISVHVLSFINLGRKAGEYGTYCRVIISDLKLLKRETVEKVDCININLLLTYMNHKFLSDKLFNGSASYSA